MTYVLTEGDRIEAYELSFKVRKAREALATSGDPRTLAIAAAAMAKHAERRAYMDSK